MKINTPNGLKEVSGLFDFVVNTGHITNMAGDDLGWVSGLTLILSEKEALELSDQLIKAVETKKYTAIYLNLVGEIHQVREENLPVAD